MGKIIFITGGARSGKSSYAEKVVKGLNRNVIYVATAIAFDDEMKERIERHKKRRPAGWDTLEAYKNLPALISEKTSGSPVLLLDCLTVMVTNLLLEREEIDWDNARTEQLNHLEDDVEKEIGDFLTFCTAYSNTAVIVSNELGMGLVPPTPLGRYFRDVQGRINQMAAAAADEVYFTVSGIPMKIK